MSQKSEKSSFTSSSYEEKIFKLKHDSNGDKDKYFGQQCPPRPLVREEKSVQKENEAEDEKGNLNFPYFLRISPIFP